MQFRVYSFRLLLIIIIIIIISLYSHNVRRIRVYKHNRMSNENFFNNILVHIFIQHSDNEFFLSILFTIFGNVRFVRARTQIMTTITYLREELPKHMIVPSMNYLFKQVGINVGTQCTECFEISR